MLFVSTFVASPGSFGSARFMIRCPAWSRSLAATSFAIVVLPPLLVVMSLVPFAMSPLRVNSRTVDDSRAALPGDTAQVHGLRPDVRDPVHADRLGGDLQQAH